MKKFQELLDVVNQLLGPNGCPWDREQTMQSVRSSPVEEACELKEAIESEDEEHIKEELGDLFFNAVFLAKLAEKEHRFTMKDVLDGICEKLIRRHPHVFGEIEIKDSEAVVEQWERIKKAEKGKEARKSALDSIPAGLPIFLRAHKVLKKMRGAGFPASEYLGDDLGDAFLKLLIEGDSNKIDLEHEVRKSLAKLENLFRKTE